VIIVTSNQERNLPEAFLRRCVFYYISAPNEGDLRKIVRRRLMAGPDGGDSGTRALETDTRPLSGPQGDLYEAALQRFSAIQSDQSLLKRPATAEMLNWLRALTWKGITAEEVRSNSRRVFATFGILAKTKEDLDRLQRAPSAQS
jgi:MoxR-like ATPase